MAEKNIYQKLCAIQAKLKAPKTLFNKFAGYHYRSAESILEALKPLLHEEQVVLNISDEIIEVSDRIYVKATASLINATILDEIITATALAREPLSKKGSDESQITGAASSYARKYALNGLFAIDDGVDADSTNDHGKSTPATPPVKVEKKDLTLSQYESGVKAIEKASYPELVKFESNLDKYDENGANVKKMRKQIENKFKAMDDAGKR